MKTYEQVRKTVKEKLSEKRFYHSECVEKRCVEYAKRYGADEKKARLIGIAHDIAKEMPKEEKIKYAEANNIEVGIIERQNPELLHAQIGADICQKEFGFTDDMADAIKEHTLGNTKMTLLSKILYLADSTGIDRDYEDAKIIYEIAKNDIDKAMIKALTTSIIDTLEKGRLLHTGTIEARNEYLLNQK